MSESRHTYEWVISPVWMSHVTHMNESCHTCWVVSHIWKGYAHEWVAVLRMCSPRNFVVHKWVMSRTGDFKWRGLRPLLFFGTRTLSSSLTHIHTHTCTPTYTHPVILHMHTNIKIQRNHSISLISHTPPCTPTHTNTNAHSQRRSITQANKQTTTHAHVSTHAHVHAQWHTHSRSHTTKQMHTCKHTCTHCVGCTGWRRLIGSPKLQIIFHKRATK